MKADRNLKFVFVPYPTLSVQSVEGARVELAVREMVTPQRWLEFRKRIYVGRGTIDGARAVAATGGVIGLWPPTGIFPSLDAFVVGFARMVEVAGIDHVGLGSDYDGIGTAPRQLEDVSCYPNITQELFNRGHQAGDAWGERRCR